MSALAAAIKVDEFKSFGEILALVADFEMCRLPRSRWTHRAHLTVACWYLICHREPEATERVRNGIKRYNESQGIVTTRESGYHETMTLFWVRVVRSYLAKTTLECSLVHLVNDMVALYSNSKLPLDYYSRDLLMSWEARLNWVEPDLKPLP